LPIDRVFSMKGFGTIVTGTLVSGEVRVEDELLVLPGRTAVKVRGVQVHGTRQEAANAGQRTALNLLGVDVADLARGQTLAEPGAFEETRLADAVIDVLPDARPLKPGARVRFHQGTAEILARLSPIGPTTDGAPLAPGSHRFVRVRFERPSVLVRGDRFILRAYSPPTTVAGGLILDPRPPRVAIRTELALARSRELEPQPGEPAAVSSARAAARMVQDAGTSGLPTESLVSRLGIAPPERSSSIDSLVSQKAAVKVGERLVAPAIIERLERAVIEALTEHHAREPLSEGIPREEARERLFGRGHPDVFERVVNELAASGRVTGRERLALASHRLTLSAEEERARSAIAELFRASGLTPPDASAIPEKIRESTAVVDRMLKLLQRQRVLVRLEGLLFHEEALSRLKAEVGALKADRSVPARLDVALFKEKFGVTRKFAIPLLEYLDRERLTRRVGDARVLI
jgi:selenocysteine-specific elongation factor